MTKKRKIDIWSAEYPARKKAIRIMEYLAEYLGDEGIFDCKGGDTTWYDIEDTLTNIINGKTNTKEIPIETLLWSFIVEDDRGRKRVSYDLAKTISKYTKRFEKLFKQRKRK